MQSKDVQQKNGWRESALDTEGVEEEGGCWTSRALEAEEGVGKGAPKKRWTLEAVRGEREGAMEEEEGVGRGGGGVGRGEERWKKDVVGGGGVGGREC